MKNLNTIVEQMKSGNNESFGEFYNQTYRRVFSQSLVWANGDKHLAEEFCQQAYVTFVENASRVKNSSAAISYLFTICKNTALQYFRKYNRETLVNENAEGKNMFDTMETPNEAVKPEAAYLMHEKKTAILGVVASLPENYKEVVLCHYLNGKSVNETAKLLNSTPNSIKYRLKAARSYMKAVLLDLKAKDAFGFAVLPIGMSMRIAEASLPVGAAAAIFGGISTATGTVAATSTIAIATKSAVAAALGSQVAATVTAVAVAGTAMVATGGAVVEVKKHEALKAEQPTAIVETSPLPSATTAISENEHGTVVVSATPKPTATVKPSPTATVTPTQKPTATPTPTAKPTAKPTTGGSTSGGGNSGGGSTGGGGSNPDPTPAPPTTGGKGGDPANPTQEEQDAARRAAEGAAGDNGSVSPDTQTPVPPTNQPPAIVNPYD